MSATDIASLTNVPFDIQDYILSLLVHPKDLFALALTSQYWSRNIIPWHLEYRELCIQPNRPLVWRHLAARPDLASRIRSIRFMTPKDTMREMYPHTLSGEPFFKPQDFSIGLLAPRLTSSADSTKDMLATFEHMVSLRKFTWINRGCHDVHPVNILMALANCRDLEEVELGTIWFSLSDAYSQPKVAINSGEDAAEKVTCLRNLRKLALPYHENDWSFTEIATCRSLSVRSPFLQDLTIAYTQVSEAWSTTQFPHLTSLHIIGPHKPPSAFTFSMPILTSSSTNDGPHDSRVQKFLEAHPTLKRLTFLPTSQRFTHPTGFLPNLEEVRSSPFYVASLLDDPAMRLTRRWKTLGGLVLDSCTMQSLEQLAATLGHQSLKELAIEKCEDVHLLRRIASIFPSIEVLDIAQFGLAQKHGPRECVATLSLFPSLRYFMDPFIWTSIVQSPNCEAEKAHLASQCPKLEKIRVRKASPNISPEVDLVAFINRSMYGSVQWMEREDRDLHV